MIMRKGNWKKLTALLLTAAVSLTTGVTSQAEETTTEGEINYSDGSRYEGDVVNGKREGNGTIYFKDGSWTKGVWYDDIQQGPGETHYPDGNILTGFWLDDVITGSVLYVRADGSSSRYIYRNGEANGLSVTVDKNGKISAAVYENHKKTTTKLVTWTDDDGTVYYAEKKSDVTDEGNGIAISGDSVYIGEFQNGAFNGTGTNYFGCDYLASGSFEDGELNGMLIGYVFEDGEPKKHLRGVVNKKEESFTGICYNADGSYRIGTINVDDEWDGISVEIKKDGTQEVYRNDDNGEKNITSQLWEDNSGNKHIGTKKNGGIDGYGLRIYKNNEIYIGNFSEGQTDGMGLCYYPDSNFFSYGENKNGHSEGHVMYFWPSRCYYDGMAENGKLNGEGTIYYMDGGTKGGTWKDDSLYSGKILSVQKDGSVAVTVYENGKVKK